METPGDISTFSPVLLKQAAEGDNRAFKEIYDRIGGKMYSLCVRYAGNTGEAADLFQEGFVKLYRHLNTFRNEGSFEGWARRIFVTTCLDHIKKKKMQLSELTDAIPVVADNHTGFDKLSLDDMMNVVQDLPDGYRTIINLYIIEGYTHKEIAAMFGITESGSKSQLHKARLYLKKKYPSLR
ncbi:MAG TPA: RNA polymerase sigma factor [Chitinophagaceae bacterium]|nr:RNA polymerase sigma factor [Chitinophagaceae bacterium]